MLAPTLALMPASEDRAVGGRVPAREGVATLPSDTASLLTCPSRGDFESGSADEDDTDYPGLSERSQAIGSVLSLLLVALIACLLGLLLHKKERR